MRALQSNNNNNKLIIIIIIIKDADITSPKHGQKSAQRDANTARWL